MIDFARRGVPATFAALRRDHGDLARLRLPGGAQVVAVARPDAVRRILHDRRDNYIKGSTYAPIRLITGTNLVTAEGAAWAWRRRLAQPAFTRDGVARYLPAIAACADATLDRWGRERVGAAAPVDLQNELTALTMQIVGRTLFGVELSGPGAAASGRAFEEALAIVHDRGAATLSLPLALPTPANRRLRRALATLHREVEAILARARSDPDAPPTLLRDLLDARDPETQAALTPAQLRDEVVMLYLAGHETTATLLTWTFWALARAPEARAALQAEVDALADDDLIPAPALFERLPYARQLLHEVMRLHPPAPIIPRSVVADDDLCGYRAPAGAHAAILVDHLHRHPDFWDDPASLRPERFAPAAIAGQHKYAYLPFSLGPRTCIGNTFALWESQLILAKVLRRVTVDIDPRAPLRLAASTVHRPAAGVVLARIRPRA